ncbi:TIGR03668 family PPOX class F420-dependent oxidoreductase [Amycolatopsis suaedae]|uniref:TIGR03668 family PPOX class F420-dependent oxidoreductase n=1 Tax=Amycolatopsis suaedae TaxID=2510978 RepID=A0A4Q7JDN1_9PSEU|nr:TIGR03668 family PPOX class F420-dependent oxidoreductase [Amycolatopsis suaedae]RZQ66000.1 TIGR03668 family PPOX class F420-dependent oxidoreductase [Amycolatopsis suaedae]
MRLGTAEARSRFAAARVARLATAAADGTPHLVPVTFAVDGDTVVFAVDHKPKSTANLRRLANIEANPAVSFLVDHYDEDWTRLWWVRADGTAAVEPAGPMDALVAKYPQYADRPPEGPVVVTAVSRWSGWAFAATH